MSDSQITADKFIVQLSTYKYILHVQINFLLLHSIILNLSRLIAVETGGFESMDSSMREIESKKLIGTSRCASIQISLIVFFLPRQLPL